MKHPYAVLIAALSLIVALAGCDALAPDLDADAPLVGVDAAAQSAAAAPVRLTFEKTYVPPVEPDDHPWAWEGSVDGAFEGDLRTELVDLRVAGPIWHVVFDWIITDTPGGAYDLTARLSGVLNTNTGRVVMNGRVVDGHLLGAQVHEEGQLIIDDEFGADDLHFQGLIRIMPRTAR